MYATTDFHPAVIHTEFFEGRPMDILLAETTAEIAVETTAEIAAASLWHTATVLTTIARHRLSDEEPDADEADEAADDDDDDDDDWEDLDDDDWDDDDDDDDPDDDDDDDDEEEPANNVTAIRVPLATRSS